MDKSEMIKLQTMLTDLYMAIHSMEDRRKLLNALDIINSVINKQIQK